MLALEVLVVDLIFLEELCGLQVAVVLVLGKQESQDVVVMVVSEAAAVAAKLDQERLVSVAEFL
jgi:hypothetical protein